MKDPNIKTAIKHSLSKNAWNIVGTIPGDKYKVARIPYINNGRYDERYNHREKSKAYNHAEFINFCFNNSKEIIEHFNLKS